MKKIKSILHKAYTILDCRPAVFLIIISLFFNCVIELSARQSFLSFLTYICDRPHMFLINTAVIMTSFSIAFFVKRRAFTVLFISVLWFVLCSVNFILMAFRATPFITFDLTLAADGLRLAAAYFSKVQIALLTTAIAALIAGIAIAYKKLPRCGSVPVWKRIVGALIPCAVLLIPFVSAAAAGLDVSLGSDNMLQAYDEFGFAYCVASSLLSSGIDKPETYSQEAVYDILARFGSLKPAQERRPNVIFVQLESFFDPRLLWGGDFTKDPVPVFGKLKDEFPSGYLRVPSFGGGTANTEFEVLTGMSLNHFGVGEYPYETVLTERSCESMAYNLKNLGYAAHAIHNHAGTFYSRNTVYSYLGFDSFIPLEYMVNAAYTPTGWAKDDVLTDSIISSLKRTDSPDFVFTVTVQCHGKYPENYSGESSGIAEREAFDYLNPGAFEYFLTQLSQTDAFIGSLLSSLEDFSEDTVVVLYGDHLPPLPIPANQLRSGSLYMTEYVIWSNFNIDAADRTLSAYELSPYVLSLLGIDEGHITKVHRSYDDEADRDEALRLISYDMLYGSQYAGGGEPLYLPSDLQIGDGGIKIKSVFTDGEYSYVRGNNFTPFSEVFADGKKQDTDYINGSLLRTPYILNHGDRITVCQSGIDREILGSTDEFEYRRTVAR